MKAAIYCRVSTEAQEREGTSLKSQLEACLKHCQSQNYEIAQQYQETYSGLTIDRPLLSELRQRVRNREFDILVIYALDRLSRDPVHHVILQDELEKNEVKLEAITETIDNSDFGKFIVYTKGLLGKWEAEKIKERTQRGIRERALSGRLPRGCSGLYGYHYDKATGKREIIPKEAEIVKRIFHMCVDDKTSTYQIAVSLNSESIPSQTGRLWPRQSVWKLLSNPAYYGATYAYPKAKGKEKLELPGVTPPIISKELFEAAQVQLEESKHTGTRKLKYHYLLKGMVFCGVCGRRMCGRHGGRATAYYECNSHSRPELHWCHNPAIQAKRLEDEVWAGIVDRIQHSDEYVNDIRQMMQNPGDHNKLRAKLDINAFRIKKLAEQIERTIRMYTILDNGDLSEGIQQVRELRAEKARIEKESKDLENQLTKLMQMESQLKAIKQVIDSLNNNLETATFEQKRRMMITLKIRVTVDHGKAELDGNIPVANCTRYSNDVDNLSHIPFSLGLDIKK